MAKKTNVLELGLDGRPLEEGAKRGGASLNQLAAAARQAAQDVDKAERGSKSAGASFNSLRSSGGNSFAALSQSAARVAAGVESIHGALETVHRAFQLLVAGEIVHIGSEYVAEFAKAEAASHALDASLRATGRGGVEALELIKKGSEEVERVTTSNADALLGATAKLAALSKALSPKELVEAQHAVVGLSAVLHLDLEQSATLVAKAVDGNTQGLQRYGLVVRDGIDQHERLANMLEKTAPFWERARADAETTAGALAQVSVQSEHLKESVGGLIADILGLSTNSAHFTDQLRGARLELDRNHDKIVTWGKTAIGVVVSVGQTFGYAAKLAFDFGETLGLAFRQVSFGLAADLSHIINPLISGINLAIDARNRLQGESTSHVSLIDTAFNEAEARHADELFKKMFHEMGEDVSRIVGAAGSLGAALRGEFASTAHGAERLHSSVQVVGDDLDDTVKKAKKAREELVGFFGASQAAMLEAGKRSLFGGGAKPADALRDNLAQFVEGGIKPAVSAAQQAADQLFGGVLTSFRAENIHAAGDIADEIHNKFKAAVPPINELWLEAARGMERTFADGFSNIFENGLDGFRGFAEEMVSVAEHLAAQILAAMAADKLGISKLISDLQERGTAAGTKDLQAAIDGRLGSFGKPARYAGGVVIGAGVGYESGSSISGAAAGAASGAALAGPWGAVAGGVAGFVGGLFGHARKAHEAAEEMHRALEQFDNSLKSELGRLSAPDDYVRNIIDTADRMHQALGEFAKNLPKGKGPNELRDTSLFTLKPGASAADDIQSIEANINALQDSLKWITDPKVRTTLQDQIDTFKGWEAELQRAHAEAERALGDDIAVRQLKASGLDSQAEALRHQLDQQKELQDAVKQGFAPELIDQLKALQQAEDDAAAAAKRATQSLAESELGVRELRAQGHTAEADAMRRQLDHAKELQDALKQDFGDSYIKHLKEVQEAEDAAASALQAVTKRGFGADLGARSAALGGDAIEALRIREQERAAQELDSARQLLEAGTITKEMFDQFSGVLKGELVNALDEARNAAKRFSDDFAANIGERSLRAAGKDRDADLFRFEFDQQRELADALKSLTDHKITQDLFDQLVDLQRREHDKFLAQLDGSNLAQAEAARAVKPTDIVAQSVAGISATQALRISDLILSSNTWLSEIAFNTRVLTRPEQMAGFTRTVQQQAQAIVNFYGPVYAVGGGRQLARDINEELAAQQAGDSRYIGEASVS